MLNLQKKEKEKTMSENETAQESNKGFQDPLSAIFGLAVESSMKSTIGLHSLIKEYERKVEVSIPIDEIKKVMNESFKQSLSSEDGLFKSMMQG